MSSRGPVDLEELEFLERCLSASTPLDPETVPRLVATVRSGLELQAQILTDLGAEIDKLARERDGLLEQVELLKASHKDLIAALDAERTGRVRPIT